jgi:hypothetical protein
MAPSMKVHVRWMNLMKNQIKQKFKDLEGKGYKAKDSFFKPFDKKKMFNGLKMFDFRYKPHVQKIILPENMFSCPLKLILGFFGIFYVSNIKPKYSYIIMFEYEKSPLTRELSYIGIFKKFHLSLFHVHFICTK